MSDFLEFRKIARLSRNVIVSEKIDGTNAQVFIDEDGQIKAGSRTRWITPQEDNYGFASWVEANRGELLKLGVGRHFGEWWGAGIQRRYGLTEKRFSLFNTSRWEDDAVRPACCSVVPVLYRGKFDTDKIKTILDDLEKNGSVAAPGFMRPEGVMVFHIDANVIFKKTILNDESPKSLVKEG